ncbi:MAG: glycosyltransferase family 2 protein [Clostridia bacterium]|nr:glycosyltransferase family 2 protein [Clostridia bacterium]
MKISIIIPIYNVEQYLRQCIESVICQTYRDIEVILVDDGSPDGCPQICDEYAARDARVTVIHKVNGGLSDARNAGILAATGDYILFVDGDDWLNSGEDLAALADRASLTKADVISFSYTKIYDHSGKKMTCLPQETSMPTEYSQKKDQAKYLTERGLYIASAWNKMVRLSCLKRNNLFFKVGETSEDVVWCLQLLIAVESLDYLNRYIYCYRQRVGSISKTVSLKKCILLAEQIIRCTKLTLDAEELSKPCRFYIAYQIAAFMKMQTLVESYPREGVRILNPYAWFLCYHAGNRKVRALRLMATVFGFSGACRILYIVYGTRHVRK